MRDISGKGRTAGNTRPFLTYIPKCIPAAAGFLFLTLTLMLSGCSSGSSLPAAPAVPETAAEAESSPAERENARAAFEAVSARAEELFCEPDPLLLHKDLGWPGLPLTGDYKLSGAEKSVNNGF